MPESAFEGTGTPNTGSAVMRRGHAGRCAAPPAPAMTTFKPAAFAPLAKATMPVGGAMGRDDQRLIRDAERVERVGGAAHDRPVGLAAHDDGDRLRCFAHEAPPVPYSTQFMGLALKGTRQAAQGATRPSGLRRSSTSPRARRERKDAARSRRVAPALRDQIARQFRQARN